MHVLAADIGGTNSNFAIVDVKNKPRILFKSNKDTDKVSRFSDVVNEFLAEAKEKGFKVSSGCFAVAGPVKNQYAKMTHASFAVDKKELLKKTPLKNVTIMNDFIAISYAVNCLSKNDFVILQKGDPIKNQTKALIGAGTGLGKSILYYDQKKKIYLPLASEGGHADFSVDNEFELALAYHILMKNSTAQLHNEHLVSGNGIVNIYNYLQATKYKDAPSGISAAQISATKSTNPASKEAFDTFIRFYARVCRNFSLETMCCGGLYIAGGIVAKNKESFGKDFLAEYANNTTFPQLLKNIPITLITNYDISLIGAAYRLLI